MKDLSFHCTACGKCCKSTLLDLLPDEALEWAANGGELGFSAQLLYEVENSPVRMSDWMISRSFAARSGKRNIRVLPHLYGMVSGTCHHLMENMCQIYDRRPQVCQVYPAEVTEPIDTWEIDPKEKSCPPEAWSGAPFTRGKRLLSTRPERALIFDFQQRQQESVEFMRLLALEENFDTGTPHVAGRVVYRLPTERLAHALTVAKDRIGDSRPSSDWWHFYETNPDSISYLKRERVHVVGVMKSLSARAIFVP